MRTFNISKGKVREPQTQFGISSKDQKLLSAFKLQSNYWEKRAGKKKMDGFQFKYANWRNRNNSRIAVIKLQGWLR